MIQETFFSQSHGELVESIFSENKSVSFHSEFTSGVNLKVEDSLVYISYPYFQLPPFGIILDKQDMDQLKQILSSAKLAIFDNYLLVDNYKVSLSKSFAEKTHVERKKLVTNVEIDCFKQYVNEDVYKHASINHLINLIGSGQGLTPSGDDFIVGLLALDSRIKCLPETIFAQINQSIQDKMTTDVSISYLSAALKQQFSTAVVKVIDSLDEPEKLAYYLEELSHTGHSSGRDTISGIYFGLKNFIY